jgi:predicted  nucleic acid-binding Zn-ribbon protein
MATRERLQELLARLEQERDELRVRIHLASKDAQDEFAALEGRLDALRAKASAAAADARETADDVGEVLGETARAIGEELRAGYERVRAAIAERD